MTELELFARQGGCWYCLENGSRGSLYKTYKQYCDGRNYFNETPVYQVFNSDGKRLFASTNYIEAVRFYESASLLPSTAFSE